MARTRTLNRVVFRTRNLSDSPVSPPEECPPCRKFSEKNNREIRQRMTKINLTSDDSTHAPSHRHPSVRSQRPPMTGNDEQGVVETGTISMFFQAVEQWGDFRGAMPTDADGRKDVRSRPDDLGAPRYKSAMVKTPIGSARLARGTVLTPTCYHGRTDCE